MAQSSIKSSMAETTKEALHWHLYVDFDSQSIALAEQVADDLAMHLEKKSAATLSVPGGSTPAGFLQHLSQQDIDWSRVFVVLNDERWVPLDHEQSNEAMIRKTLQCNFAESVNIVPLYNAEETSEKAVETFNVNQAQYLSLDVCVQGMGEDGHTASLFPVMQNQAEALDAEALPSLIIARVPDKELRVSLNLSALLSAEQHYLLIRGEAKKEVLKKASREKTTQWPISYLTAATEINVYYSS